MTRKIVKRSTFFDKIWLRIYLFFIRFYKNVEISLVCRRLDSQTWECTYVSTTSFDWTSYNSNGRDFYKLNNMNRSFNEKIRRQKINQNVIPSLAMRWSLDKKPSMIFQITSKIYIEKLLTYKQHNFECCHIFISYANFVKKCGTLHDFACHPCAGAMLIFSVSFQF
jgi:hypothetical protein